MTFPLKDKVAFITGASRGIGQACAVALAQAGAHCIISARTQGGLIQTDDQIKSQGGTATLLPMDLGGYEAEHIDLIGPSIASQFNRLDIFIHAAFQYIPLTPVTQITDAAWDKNIQVNLSSCWRLIRTLSPLLCATANAHAIFLQPIMLTVQPFWAPITAIKAALETIIYTWQQEIIQLSSLTTHYLSLPPTNTLLRQSFFPAENKKNLNTPTQTAQEILSVLYQ